MQLVNGPTRLTISMGKTMWITSNYYAQLHGYG